MGRANISLQPTALRSVASLAEMTNDQKEETMARILWKIRLKVGEWIMTRFVY